jgi:hypothetical protein
MTHREKVDYLLRDLKALKINKSLAAPPIFKLIWLLGFEIPPPMFLSQMVNCLILSPIVFSGIVVLLVVMFFGGLSLMLVPLYGCAILALLVNMSKQAATWTNQGTKLNLPPWKDYPNVPPTEDNDIESP